MQIELHADVAKFARSDLGELPSDRGAQRITRRALGLDRGEIAAHARCSFVELRGHAHHALARDVLPVQAAAKPQITGVGGNGRARVGEQPLARAFHQQRGFSLPARSEQVAVIQPDLGAWPVVGTESCAQRKAPTLHLPHFDDHRHRSELGLACNRLEIG